MSTLDYMMWVENGEYNRTVAENAAANRRRAEADSAVRRAKENARAVQRMANQSSVNDAEFRRQLDAEINRLLAGIDSLDAEMRANFARYVQRTQGEMADIRRSVTDVSRRADQLDEKIDDLAEETAERFRRLAEAQENQRNRAQIYANQLSSTMRRIGELHPDKFEPEKFADLQMAADFVRVDMTNGDYQAAIGVAQSNLPAALSLQSRLERLNEEFELLRSQVHACTEAVSSRIKDLQDSDKNRREVTVGENVYEYDGDIAFWSNGLFHQAEQNMHDLLRRAAQNESDMNLENMRMDLSHLEQIEHQLNECQQLAENEFYLCGMIQNMAGNIYESLTEDESWELIQSGFAGDDARRAYHMAYSDGAGNTSVFAVIPNREVKTGGKPGEIQFLVDVSDGEKKEDQQRCSIIRRGVIERLSQSRVDVGEHNRAGQYRSYPGTTQFFDAVTAQADRIKDGRLEAVRGQLRLVNTIQEREENGV